MSKYFKYILIICPIILSILLTINIYKYISNKTDNNNFIKSTKSYEVNIKESTAKKEKLEQELIELNEKNKDKIWELNRWIKWNQEMIEKIN